MHAPERIATDLPCLKCGYNLRTLPADARCPECGYDTFLTLHGGLPIIDTRARRLRLAAACLTLAGATVWFTLLLRNDVGYNTVHGIWTTDPAWVFLPVSIAWLVAMTLFALPQHRLDGRPLFRRTRRLMLATAPAALLSVGLWEYAYAWVPYDRFYGTKPLLYLPLLGIAPGFLLVLWMLLRLLTPLGMRRFRLPLRIMSAAWWVILPAATLTFASQFPDVSRPIANARSPFPPLPHAVHELLEPVIFALVLALVLAYLVSIPALACLGLNLALSRPRDPKRFLVPTE